MILRTVIIHVHECLSHACFLYDIQFTRQIDSPEKWRENMEMALEMFKAQKAMMQQDDAAADTGAADVDDLDDD